MSISHRFTRSANVPLRRKSARILLLGSYMGLYLTLTLSAQTTATVLGMVRDPSNALVSNAQVTARNEDTGFTRQSATSASGEYVLNLLPVGRYTLTVKADGSKTKTLSRILLEIDQQAHVDVTLELGNLSEQVQ